MSTSSCPRCAQQVTLPVGASTTAQVRCPLCRAQYSLSEALVNMPPLLEVLDDGASDEPDNWFDASPVDGEADEANHLDFELAEAGRAAELESTADPASPTDEAEDYTGGTVTLEFPAEEADLADEELDFQQRDTEVEEATAGDGPEPRHGEPGDDFAPLSFGDAQISRESAAESVLDFGEPDAGAQTLDLHAGRAAADDDLDIDFGAPLGDQASAKDLELGFDAPPDEQAADSEEFAIDFEDAPAVGADDATIDLSAPLHEPAEEGVASFDFGDPIEPETTAPVAAAAEPAPDSKPGKKKKKKDKAARQVAGDPEPRKRSLAGTLVNVVVPSLLAVPLALYGALWLGPDYDLLGIGTKLPGWMVPSTFSRRSAVVAQAPQPQLQLPAGLGGNRPAASRPPDEDPAGPAGEATPAAGETSPAASAAEPPTQPANESPAAPSTSAATPVADEPRATDAPASEPATDQPPSIAAPPDPRAPEPPSSTDKPPLETVSDQPPASVASDPPTAPAAPVQVVTTPKEESPDLLLDGGDKPQPPSGTADAAADAKEMPEEAEELPPPAAGPPANGFRQPRAITADELTAAVAELAQADEQMAAAEAASDKTDLKRRRAGYYVSLYRLADMLARSPADDVQLDASKQDVERRASAIAADPARLQELKNYGGKWLAFSKRTTDGVALAGTVQSTERSGQLYELKLALLPETTGVTVLTNIDPGLVPGDEAVALGTIVERPQEELAGYAGAEPTVVWSGLTLKVPSAGN